MGIFAWSLLVLVILLILCWLSVVYFRIQRKLKVEVGGKYRLIEYAIFIPFILFLVPTGMFLPAWLAEKMNIVERTENSTILFLCVGMLVLSTSVIYGWNKSKK